MFKTYLEIGVAMSVVIIFILLISKFLNRKYKLRWRYLIWLFIAIRLIIPINYKSVNLFVDIVTPDVQIGINSDVGNNQLLPVIDFYTVDESANTRPLVSTSKYDANLKVDEAIEIKENKYDNSISMKELFVNIWVIGMIVISIYYIANLLIFNARIKSSLKEEKLSILEKVKKEFGILKNIKVYKSALINSPMLIGFLKPRIIMPCIDYTSEELELVFRHELTHFSRKDIWYKIVLMTANIIHWINPLVYVMRRYADKDVEYTCDDIVTKSFSIEQKKNYSKTILKTMEMGGM